MAGDRQPHFAKVAMILAVSAFMLFLAAGFVWVQQPLDDVLNEAVVIMLTLVATTELGLAMFFFRKAGQ